ncbi:ABC transporter permease [uncultured Enterococcus sp.]|uniref:ABC transporter permease n=1 Tax=uncultured Enterococcus sp. TaxID=167972 RepID=UPI002AA95E99|nr:ABC transporter permease [uncultured Enterococcus sp.]
MNYLQRGIRSVTRRKGKSFILFAVIFILGNVIAGAIAIQQSTENVEKKVKKELGATATVDLDYDKLMEENPSGGQVPGGLSEEDIKKIGSSPYVKEYDYSVNGMIQVKNLKTYQMDSENSAFSVGMMQYLQLKGTNLTSPPDFSEKKIDLTDGRMFTQEDLDSDKPVAIISEELAELNGVGVGDQLVLDSNHYSYSSDGTSSEAMKGDDHPVEIIGIFKPKTVEKKKDDNAQNSMNDQIFQTEQFNTLYMPNNAIKAINKQEYETGKRLTPDMYTDDFTEESMNQATPTYILKSPDDVDAFKEETEPLIPEFFKLSASTDQYEQVGSSMKKLSQIAGYVVMIAVGAALVIISLIVVLFLRDRKHEFGIYLSLGEKRNRVLAQVIIELLMISLLAMGISLITGNLLGDVVSNSLLSGDMLAETANNGMSNGMSFVAGANTASTISAEDITNAYAVKFSLSYIITFLAAGMATILASAILPLLYILRLNPKKIMM